MMIVFPDDFFELGPCLKFAGKIFLSNIPCRQSLFTLPPQSHVRVKFQLPTVQFSYKADEADLSE